MKKEEVIDEIEEIMVWLSKAMGDRGDCESEEIIDLSKALLNVSKALSIYVKKDNCTVVLGSYLSDAKKSNSGCGGRPGEVIPL